MGLDVHVGTFNTNTSTGNQSITGLAFQPKLVIFVWQGATAAIGMGAAVSSTQRAAASVTIQTAVNTSQTLRGSLTTRCIHVINTNAVIRWAADFVSMNSDGFTINWVTVQASPTTISYMALGGTDLTDMAVGLFSINNATGNESVTGLSFQPDCVLAFGTGVNESQTSDATMQIAAAKSSSERWGITLLSDDAAAAALNNSLSASDRWVFVTGTSDTITGSADFVSMNSNGFTYNRTVATSARDYMYVAIKGANLRFKLGQLTQPVSTGNQSVSGLGFAPLAELFVSDGKASSASVTPDIRASVGLAQSSSARAVCSLADNDAADPTVATSQGPTGQVVRVINGTATVLAAADFVSQDSDGFTINWSAVDATQRIVNYLAIGLAGAGGTTFTVDLAGAISPAGALLKQAQKTLSGAISPAAALRLQAQKLFSGSMSPAGSLSSTKVVLMSLAGAISPAGTLARQAQKIFTAAASSSGALVLSTAKTLAGSTSPVGSLTRALLKALFGSVSPAGAVANIKTTLLDLAGAISPAGALAKQAQKTFSGAASPSGALARSVSKSLNSAISPAGAITKTVQRGLAGAIGFLGELVNSIIALVIERPGSVDITLVLHHYVDIDPVLHHYVSILEDPQAQSSITVTP